MCKKLSNPEYVNNKKGTVSMAFALMLPIILVVIFVGIDFLHISAEKNAMQRKVDSAALTAAILSSPTDDVVVDADGFIVPEVSISPDMLESPEPLATVDPDAEPSANPDTPRTKICVITEENMARALTQLSSQHTPSELEVRNISTPEQMENGIVRIQAKGYVDNLWLDFLMPDNKFPYVVEGYAVCSYTQKS